MRIFLRLGFAEELSVRPQKPCRVPSLLRLMKVGAGGGDDHDDDDDDVDDVDEDYLIYSLFIIIY